MKSKNPALCADCGQTIDRGVAPDSSGRCERCAEAASVRPDDRDRDLDETLDQPRRSERKAAIERLRTSYHEARAFVATKESDPYHRGQLDWIFGVHGDDVRGAAPLDARTSELIVLWLEDLVRHLEELAVVGAPGDPAAPGHRAARGLHDATREFANAFRRAVAAECRP